MTTQFAVTYRVSNTAGWRIYGLYSSLEEARAARTHAVKTGFTAPKTATTQGKILGWNIEERNA